MDNILTRKEKLQNTYLNIALQGMPRILSLMNREQYRPTYGSFDRNYWQYKMIDFSGSLFQTATLSLALAYTCPLNGNIYYNNLKILELSEGAINYLSKIQNKDGSFNHNYPYIYSVAAVAFPIYAVTEAHLLLKSDPNYNINEESFINCVMKSADWLIHRFDSNVINQETASLVALYNIFLITQDERCLKAIQTKLLEILKHQSNEGWFNEYGGCDIGYSTLTVDYLAKYYIKANDNSVIEPLRLLIHFLKNFIYISGTLGGEYASRNNEFVIPSGFEYMSDVLPESEEMANSIIKSLTLGSMMNPNNMDDVYFCMNHHSFFQAAQQFNKFRKGRLILPTKKVKQSYTKFFPQAQILIITNHEYSLIVGCGKGGVLRVYKNVKDHPKLVLTDCGYIGKSKNDKIISNQWLDGTKRIEYNEQEKNVTITCAFHKFNFSITSPLKIIVSRLALPLLSNTSYFRKKFYKYLRKKMIYSAPYFPLELKRRIEFNEDDIKILDTISSRKKKIEIKSIQNIPKFTTIYGQSKNFFQIQELDYLNLGDSQNLKNLLKSNGIATVCKTLNLRKEGLTIEYL